MYAHFQQASNEDTKEESMSNSIPDIQANGTWMNGYALSGIAVGSALVVQNKTSETLLTYISATQPTGENGFALKPLEAVMVSTGEAGFWFKGVGPVSIQNN